MQAADVPKEVIYLFIWIQMNNNLEPLATQNYQRQMWNADTSNAELNSETASKIWKSLLIGQNPDTLQVSSHAPIRG